MSASQILLPIITAVIFGVQFFTGFFIPAELQVGILYLINIISRMAVGRDIFGEIKPVVLKRFNTETKSLVGSKTFWTCIIGIVAAGAQALGTKYGFEIDLLRYSVPILSGIGIVVGIITKQPIGKLK